MPSPAVKHPAGKKPSKKLRLDVFLTEHGLCDTRAKAQGLILAGDVLVNGQRVDKSGFAVDPETATVSLKGEKNPYVSRGGLKLAKALGFFDVNPTGRICLDVGASTGGFTHCLLEKGAERVYAVDVGYGQLAWALQQDPRVVSLERTNARHLKPGDLPEPVSLAVMDVSFISLTKVVPALLPLFETAGPAHIVLLIKPQFEYQAYLSPTDTTGFRGVIHEASQHRQILRGVLGDLKALLPGWTLRGVTTSPLLGPKGNREFLACWQRQARP